MSNAKPLLILQLRPEDDTSDSEYNCILKYGCIPAQSTYRIRIEKTGIPTDLDLEHFSAIIVGGSPFDISTPQEQKSATQNKIEGDFRSLLTKVVARDFPFLGACSGNGLLGSYLGASISTHYGEPVGCVTVDLTHAGRHDPLLVGFPTEIDVLLGHKEACDNTPDGATLLIQGRDCPVQMFRVGQNVYATQFHPEADPEEFNVRIEAYKHYGYFAAGEAEQLINRLSGCKTPYSQEILRRFVARYCA